MAILRAPSAGGDIEIGARTLVGRSSACGLRVAAVHASSEHASLNWTGWRWEVRDLGSRNGTFLNGARLEAGQGHPISKGDTLAFGEPDLVFTVRDVAPPVASAQSGSMMRKAKDGLLVLPDDRVPEVSVYMDREGAWVLEDAEGNHAPAEDGQLVVAGGSSWQLSLPAVDEGTPLLQAHLSLDALGLRFAVSRDEERVEITLEQGGMRLALEPREHAYVLLTLARLRAEDAELPESQQGWRDRGTLERMLGMDANALNVSIHRARQQLSAAGVVGAARIVEVRRGQRRLGSPRFSIGRLDEGEG